MTPSELLDSLHEEGVVASGTFNDGLDTSGWLGWNIEDGILTIHFDRAIDREKFSHAWLLVDEDNWVIPA